MHMLTCGDEAVATNRAAALDELTKSLAAAKTPEKVQNMLLHGIASWTANPSSTHAPLYRGSVLPVDCILVQAYQEQSEIGWDHLLRGRTSLKWSAAYRASIAGSRQQQVDPMPWNKQVILALWAYTRNLWQFRNGIVHGQTVEAAAELEYTRLKAAVTCEYAQFDTDPHVISAQFNALFTRRSLHERLKMDRDSLSCWLRTVAEAKEHQRLFRSTLSEMAKRFFQPRRPNASGLVPISVVRHPVGSTRCQGT
jgi:hypothetical protein